MSAAVRQQPYVGQNVVVIVGHSLSSVLFPQVSRPMGKTCVCVLHRWDVLNMSVSVLVDVRHLGLYAVR